MTSWDLRGKVSSQKPYLVSLETWTTRDEYGPGPPPPPPRITENTTHNISERPAGSVARWGVIAGLPYRWDVRNVLGNGHMSICCAFCVRV